MLGLDYGYCGVTFGRMWLSPSTGYNVEDSQIESKYEQETQEKSLYLNKNSTDKSYAESSDDDSQESSAG